MGIGRVVCGALMAMELAGCASAIDNSKVEVAHSNNEAIQACGPEIPQRIYELLSNFDRGVKKIIEDPDSKKTCKQGSCAIKKAKDVNEVGCLEDGSVCYISTLEYGLVPILKVGKDRVSAVVRRLFSSGRASEVLTLSEKGVGTDAKTIIEKIEDGNLTVRCRLEKTEADNIKNKLKKAYSRIAKIVLGT